MVKPRNHKEIFRIPKAFDVRLTVVGDRFFAVAVHAGSSEAKVDWRTRYNELRYETSLPIAEAIADQLVRAA